MAHIEPHIVILTSATGGGHNACAEALRHAFQLQYGDSFRVTIVDLWADHAPWPLNLLQRCYYFFTNGLPFIWTLFWRWSKQPIVDRIFFGWIGRWVRPQVQAAFSALQPDLIIAVHPLVQRAVRQAIRTLPKSAPHHNIPWFTVVTDLASAHPLWFDQTVTRCIVPTTEVMHIGLANGMPHEKLAVVGLPALSVKSSKTNIIEDCSSLDPALPTILVMGGAEGMGPLSRIAQAIEAQLGSSGKPAAQMVLICGTNERLRTKLLKQVWSMPVLILGFVDNVEMWMAASDLLVTKAGPSTIAEALNAGLPILLTGYLPGQEAGNVDYVVDNGAGLFCPTPEQVGQTVRRWLVENPEERAGFAAQAGQLANPEAGKEIVNEIARFAGRLP